MARYDHLQLVRLPEQLERRKHGGGSGPPPRDPGNHSTRLRGELDAAIETQRQRRRPEFVDPSLILRVQMTGASMLEHWEQLGLTLLSSDADRTLVLFADSEEMHAFRERLSEYGRGKPPDQKHPRYNAFIGSIESIGEVRPRDRIGLALREAGFIEPTDFLDAETYLLDLELWDLGRREVRERKLGQIAGYIEARGGQVFDRYIGPSITLLRVEVSGAVAQTLLTLEDVSSLEAPPEPDLSTAEAFDLTLSDLPSPNVVDEAAPVIGIIDSGVNAHPFLDDIVVGTIAVPERLGLADVKGHGTRVGGVAVFGDLRGQLAAGTLHRGARLCSAKVLNDVGEFDNRRLVPSQMREAVTTLHQRFGCRIFVIALGDRKRTYDGGKVGPWAQTLDELARELDVVIVVSAGNRQPRGGNRLEQAVTEYPDYLAEAANRFCEPAGAMNVLTVGALAHGPGLDADLAQYVAVRPITRANEPSPFSRIGPGIGGAIKPELVDQGGTLLFDAGVGRLRGGEEIGSAGVLTLHNVFIDRLFAAGSGTSYAAPLVAFKASQVLARFPGSSANLIRALMAGAADVPQAALERLQPLGGDVVRAVCGYGQVELERASFSDDARVVLYAEDELALDHFAVYQIPIPELFRSEGGERTIQVTLAYDPPARHTRVDYAGVGMSFRLVRGCQPDLIFDHYRKREVAIDGKHPELKARYNCALEPGPQAREKATLQRARITFKRNIEAYGDPYYLVVRCEGGWADYVARQRFAVVVEIAHKAQVQLYERLRQQVRLPR